MAMRKTNKSESKILQMESQTWYLTKLGSQKSLTWECPNAKNLTFGRVYSELDLI